jgi:beta-lactamase regulating signal transducer with metallopeptidase domain
VNADFLMDFAWRGCVFSVVVWAGYRVFRTRSSAATRHACLAAALVVMALIPVLVAGFGGWKLLPAQRPLTTTASDTGNVPKVKGQFFEKAVGEGDRADQSVSPVTPARAQASQDQVVREVTLPEIKRLEVVRPGAVFRWPSRETWIRVAGLMWLTGVIFCWLAIAREVVRIRAWFGNPCQDGALLAAVRSCANSLEMRHCPEVRVTKGDSGPMVVGWRRPIIVMPEAALEWPSQQCDAVLLHEMAHVKRRDGLVQFLGALVCAFHWFNPFAWLLLKGLRHEAECACDDTVLRRNIAASEYAKYLLAVASSGHFGSLATPSMANPSGMRMRVQSIMRTGVRRLALSRSSGVAIVLTAMVSTFPVMLAQKTETKPLQAQVSDTASVVSPIVPEDDVAEFIAQGKRGAVNLLTVDDHGGGIEGVVVRGFNTGRGEPVQPFQPDFVVRTGNDGRWSGDLPVGNFMVLATKGELVVADNNQAWFDITEGKSDSDVKLVLSKGREVRVSVIDAANREPVAGARVILDTGHTAVADGKGMVVMHAVPEGEHVVKVVHPPYANRQVNFNSKGERSAAVEVALVPGFKATGRVTDSSGAPVKGAFVSDNYSGKVFLCAMQKCVTDADGRYQLGWYSRERGLSSFGVAHDRFAEQYKYDLSPPADGHEAIFDFILDVGREITGQVLNDEGKPISGATVRYGSSSSLVGARWAKTDKDGRFRIIKIGETYHWPVVAEANGYAPGLGAATPGKGKDVPDIAIRMKRGLVTKGRVVDGDGKPVTGVMISPSMTIDGRPEYVGGRIGVDAKGEFQIRNLPASEVFLDLYGEGISDIRHMAFDPTKPLVLTADKPGVIIGKVVDAETGKPVESFYVDLGFPKMPKEAGAPDASFSGTPQKVQSLEGKFLMEGLVNRAGHEVTVSAAGYNSTIVDCVVGRPLTDKQWPVVIALHRGIVIGGKLTDALTGAPVTGAKVFWVPTENWVNDRLASNLYKDISRPENNQVSVVRSNGAGEAQINLPDGTPSYSVAVMADGYAPQLITGQSVSQGAALRFEPMQHEAKIRGKVTDTAGLNPNDDVVAISTPIYGTESMPWQKDGTFEIGGLPSGKVEILIHSKTTGALKVTRNVTLTSGETTEVKIEVKKE